METDVIAICEYSIGIFDSRIASMFDASCSFMLIPGKFPCKLFFNISLATTGSFISLVPK